MYIIIYYPCIPKKNANFTLCLFSAQNVMMNILTHNFMQKCKSAKFKTLK